MVQLGIASQTRQRVERQGIRGEARGFHFGSLVAMLACTLIVGCTSVQKSDTSAEEPFQTAWPAPPEPPRLVFQTVLRSLADIRKASDDERLQKMLTGVGVSDKLVYEKPASIAANGGRIYVADPQVGSVVVFDVPRRKVFRFGERPPNKLARPNSVDVDDESRVYVLDTKLESVLVFDSLGLYLFRVGKPDDFEKPVGVAASPDGKRIYVVDRGSLRGDDHKVVVFDPEGNKIQTLGPRGSAEGQFNIPLDVAVARDGSVVVLDSGNFRVQIFDSEGRFLRTFGSVGNGMGQFSRPRSVDVDDDGNIYVTDSSFNNLQIFDLKGQLLLPVGRLNMRGGPGEFALIGAVATDRNGFVYVGDNYFKKIEVYRRTDASDERQGKTKE